ITGVNVVRGDKVASRSVNRYALLARGSQTGNDITIGDIRLADTDPAYALSDPQGIFYSRHIATKAGFFRQPGDRRPTIAGVDVETDSAMDLLLKELASTGFIDDQATRI